MVEFDKIRISNFMSIGEAEVSLNTGGFTLVSGINNRPEDAAQSNGVGKSSISESIVWALTGETIRGHKEVVNRYTGGNCEVELTFSFKGHNWVVKRGMSHSKEKLLVTIKDGQVLPAKGYRDAVEVLSKELPELTFKFLNSVVILGQGLPGRFTNNSPSGRKAVLEELTNADFMINHVKEEIKNRSDFLNGQLRSAQDKKLSDSSKKSTTERALEVSKQKLDQLKAFDIEGEKKRLGLLTEQGKEEAIRNTELQNSQAEVRNKIEEKLNQKNEAQALYDSRIREIENSIRADLQAKLKKFSDGKANELEGLMADRARLDKELHQKVEERDHSKAIVSGGICKTCGQKLPSVSDEQIAKAKEDIIRLEKEIGEIKVFLDQNSFGRSEISSKYSALETKAETEAREVIKSETDQIRVKRGFEIGKIESALSSLREEEVKISGLLKESNERLITLRADYKTLSSEISRNESDIASYEKTVADYSNEILVLTLSIEEAERKIVDCQYRLKIIKQMETFASRDFRGILLEEVIQRLDSILKDYAEAVYGNRLTKFYQEGNSIEVEFDGKEYESLSGGEQQKINVLLQLSLRDLIIELTGVSGSFLLLDEVFDGLDHLGCEKMIGLFQNLNTSIFVITHHPELDIPYDYQLVVVKGEDGVASIQFQ